MRHNTADPVLQMERIETQRVNELLKVSSQFPDICRWQEGTHYSLRELKEETVLVCNVAF